LSNLLKKKSFKWDDSAQECFETLKRVMSSTPVVATPDFEKPFVVECDASRIGIGAVLMKDDHPISFESRKLKKKEELQSTYNKEMLAIMHGLSKWRQYLLGRNFLICIDHNSLQYLLRQKNCRQKKKSGWRNFPPLIWK
jgi:hypothetical protein